MSGKLLNQAICSVKAQRSKKEDTASKQMLVGSKK
jgi:hypothetical protein